MKLRFVYKGGSGSGHFGHAGRPGQVGGSISFNYSGIPPSKRSNSQYYAGGGSYAVNVDAAIKEPIRILNEELGYNTFASCEGHACNWKAGTLGYSEDMSSSAFQESYVAVYADEESVKSLENYLTTKGFEIGSTPRANVVEETYDLYKNVGNYHLIFDIKRPVGPGGRSTFALRVGSGTLNPSKAKVHTLSSGESFRNIDSSLSGQKALSQKAWDSARDTGWTEWIDLLREYKIKTDTT